MKKTSFISLLLLLLVVGGCSSGGSDEPDAPVNPVTPEETTTPKIEVTSSDTAPTFTTEGGKSEISFTSSVAWTIDVAETRTVDWVTVYPTSGAAGAATLSITTQPNTTYDERRATITLKAGTVSKTFNVTQKQKDALLVTSNKVEASADGGEITVEVQSNVSYAYQIESESNTWISHTATRALASHKEVFTLTPNIDTQKREGRITFTSGELSENITVYQACEQPSLVLTCNNYEVDAEGETIQVELNTNVEYEMQLPEGGWIEEVKSRAVSTHTHYFTIYPNTSSKERFAQIVFTNKKYLLSERVNVTQAGVESSTPIDGDIDGMPHQKW